MLIYQRGDFTENSVRKRIYKWDNLKFILIFFVVFGHILDVYAGTSQVCGMLRFFIYTFHMPLFLFISGLFSKRHIRGRMYGAFFSYLILYLLIKILVFVSKWIAYGVKPGFSFFSAAGVPWYAFALFAFCFITIALEKIDQRYVFVLSIIFGCLAGYDNGLGDDFCLMRLFVFYPFFFLGYCLDEEFLRNITRKKYVKIAAALIIAVAFLIVIVKFEDVDKFKLLFTGRNSYKKIYGKAGPLAFVSRLITYIISSLLGFSLIAVTPEKSPNNFMAKIGSRTLQIYALHMPLKYLYLGLINDRFHIEGFFKSLLPLYCLIVSIVIMAICALPFWNGIFKKILKIPIKDNMKNL